MTTTTESQDRSRAEFEALDKLEALAKAATPQNFDSAQITNQGCIECPSCDGSGEVELTADYCNYDGRAIGVQFYGIGPEHRAAEAFYRAANPAAILELIALARAGLAASTGQQAEPVAKCRYCGGDGEHYQGPSRYAECEACNGTGQASEPAIAAPAATAEPSDKEIRDTLGLWGALPVKGGAPDRIIAGREGILILAIRDILSKVYAANRLRDVRGLALEGMRAIDAAPTTQHVSAAPAVPTEKIEEIRALLSEAYAFKSTSKAAQDNINAALDLLDGLAAPTAADRPRTVKNPDGSSTTTITEYQMQLENALAEIRDLFPYPESGKLHDDWSMAMGDPLAVPEYVKGCVAAPLPTKEGASEQDAVPKHRDPRSDDPREHAHAAGWNSAVRR